MIKFSWFIIQIKNYFSFFFPFSFNLIFFFFFVYVSIFFILSFSLPLIFLFTKKMKVLPLVSLLIPLAFCASQQTFHTNTENNIEDFKHTKNSRKHVQKLLKYHPLIDGHNDFPM